MGMGARNVTARVAASLGGLVAVAPHFEPALDVPHGGVLLALPLLLALGLLDHTEGRLELPDGYYGLDSILLLLAFMALARLETVEDLRYHPPGEWGQLLGLDRVPEVRTLRGKIAYLGREGNAREWSAALCQRWMSAAPEQVGTFYIDGHVRVYNGHQAALPRHYVARQKLCLRATTDYWVNARDGQPFFVVNQVVDPGLIQVIEGEILPSLLALLPADTAGGDTVSDKRPPRHRFTLIFDREGYSPEFFSRLKDQHVACVTYHKFPQENWPVEEFYAQTVRLVSGESVVMNLAERGTWMKNGLWLRQIRKLSAQGHQTAILTTDYHADAAPLAASMFARWSQENFFKYARKHFALDRLADYQTEAVDETVVLVNPAYRTLDGQVRSCQAKLQRSLAEFGATACVEPIEPRQMESYLQKKAALQECIEQRTAELATLKKARKETPRHITIKDLPEAERFKQLSTQSKYVIDTIKMIAYRAETAMAATVRESMSMSRPDEARTLLRALYATEADLIPDHGQNTLTVRLHHSANACNDGVIRGLCEKLNETETIFPRTNLRLIFALGSN
ncbi:MAG: hypothetical protein IPP85_15370 [Propionivibrio sp.]|nr:hypothetical protein [Propionivibrio sp.]